MAPNLASAASNSELEVDVVLEMPQGGFLKCGLEGAIHFVSPLPRSFNYGAKLSRLGLEGDSRQRVEGRYVDGSPNV